MKQRKLFAAILALILCLFPLASMAEDNNWSDAGEKHYIVKLEDGTTLFSVGSQVYEGDEYIARDNKRYIVKEVDDANLSATASFDGDEEMPSIDWLKAAISFVPAVEASTSESGSSTKKLVAIYSTHTDESYIPSDGTESDDSGGGILDVAEALKKEFEAQGVEVILDETSHLPHDSGAYRRSRQTAAQLMEKLPDALIDVHRDGIPDPSEFETEVAGEDVTAVRLLVGRSNANSSANREFAKQIKAVADEQFPGLIKDIFIGKGTYNQDLLPNAILLEFGTHTTSKEKAIESTKFIATAMTSALYGNEATGNGGAANNAPAKSNSGVSKGIIALIIFVIVAAVVFAFLQTGTGKGTWNKLARHTSELTGGLIGKKPEDGEEN
jgi:stage II sporulation protein P